MTSISPRPSSIDHGLKKKSTTWNSCGRLTALANTTHAALATFNFSTAFTTRSAALRALAGFAHVIKRPTVIE
jgi:hypothetical protein